MMRILAAHIGAGPIRCVSTEGINWINVDQNPSPAVDIVADGQTYLEANFQTFGVIWSCHMLEHLPYPRGVTQFLDACRYALIPGGILRLAVPDLQKVATAYVEKKDLSFIHGPEFKSYYYKSESRAERLHWFTHSWEHTITFDFALLEMLLRDAGFTNIKKMKFGESQIPDWHYDRFESESLFCEATK